jgi:septal ring factor EnvC (AmiA/AmiB activator)
MRLAAILSAPALAAAMLLAAPAAADDHSRHHGNHTPHRAEAIRSQIENLREAVRRNDRRDRISEREASALRRDVADLRDQFRAWKIDGLSDREMNLLERRIADIRARLRYERRDGNRRPD